MKKKILIGIILLLCVLGVGLFLVLRKKGESNTENYSSTTNNTTKNTTYKLRSYTTSTTFEMTGPKGYEYDEDYTGTMDSLAIFNKKSKLETELKYKFESLDINKYLQITKKSSYERRLDSDYYKNLTWQDKKTVTVNNNEITYAKLTYNDGSTYYKEIYSISKVFGYMISCQITQCGDSDNFDTDNQLINDAWEISFKSER